MCPKTKLAHLDNCIIRSRSSFMTSRRPDTLQAYDNNVYWRTQASTSSIRSLPEVLKDDHGFKTAGLGEHCLSRIHTRRATLVNSMAVPIDFTWFTQPVENQQNSVPRNIGGGGADSFRSQLFLGTSEGGGQTRFDLNKVHIFHWSTKCDFCDVCGS